MEQDCVRPRSRSLLQSVQHRFQSGSEKDLLAAFWVSANADALERSRKRRTEPQSRLLSRPLSENQHCAAVRPAGRRGRQRRRRQRPKRRPKRASARFCVLNRWQISDRPKLQITPFCLSGWADQSFHHQTSASRTPCPDNGKVNDV